MNFRLPRWLGDETPRELREEYEAWLEPPPRRPVSALGIGLLWPLLDDADAAVDIVPVPKHHTAPRLRALREAT